MKGKKQNKNERKKADRYSIVERNGKSAIRDNRSKATYYPEYLEMHGNERLITEYNRLATALGRKPYKPTGETTGVNKNTPKATPRNSKKLSLRVNGKNIRLPSGLTLTEYCKATGETKGKHNKTTYKQYQEWNQKQFREALEKSQEATEDNLLSRTEIIDTIREMDTLTLGETLREIQDIYSEKVSKALRE